MNTLTKLLFACTLIFSFIACGDDDNSSNKNSLDGSWTAVEFAADVESSSTGVGINIISKTSVTGSDLNYDLVFDGSNWTTEGAYSYDISIELSGQTPITSIESVTDVNGSGTFSVDEDVMTIDGSFFTFMYNGQTIADTNGPQMANYEINSAGQLVFEQNETTEMTTPEISTSTSTVSKSVWERK